MEYIILKVIIYNQVIQLKSSQKLMVYLNWILSNKKKIPISPEIIKLT